MDSKKKCEDGCECGCAEKKYCVCENCNCKCPKFKPCENGCKCGCSEKKFCSCEKCDCKCPKKIE